MAGQSKVSRQRHKDKKIMIYRSENVAEPGSMPRNGYKPIHPGKLWAYVRQQSAGEYYAAKAVQVTEEMLFVVNWRADLITPDANELYIEYKGVWYDVQRIDTFEGYKEDIQVYAKLSPSTPSEDDIYPYTTN